MIRMSLLNGVLGLWLVVAGVALPHANGDGTIEDVIAGVIITVLAAWSAYAFRPRVSSLASWTLVLAGLQVASAPWVLGYGRSSFSVANDLVVGLAVAVLAGRNVWFKGQRVNQGR